MINFTCKGQETLGLFSLWWPSWTLTYIIRNQVSRQKYWVGCRIIWRTDVLMETECQSEMPRWLPLESGTIFTSCSSERHTHFFFFFLMLLIQFLFFQTQVLSNYTVMFMFYSPAWWFLPKLCLFKFSLHIHICYMHGSNLIWV